MKCFCVILVDSKTDVKTAFKRQINVVGIPPTKSIANRHYQKVGVSMVFLHQLNCN